MFSDVHAAGQRMLALVNDLLDVSKIECSVGTFHLERMDIRRPVRAVVAELAPLLGPSACSWICSWASSRCRPRWIRCACSRWCATCWPMPSSSRRTRSLEVGGELTVEGDILLWVRDHGPGIPEAELETIFEAFVQSSQTKDGSGGTGLGLAISRKIMQAHGGAITAATCPTAAASSNCACPAAASPTPSR
jgi:signal transduction histidine kinase